MEFRASLIASVAAGFAVASGAFLCFGGRTASAAIADLDQRAALVSARGWQGGPAPIGVRLSDVQPLFPILSGAHAPPELAVTLQGIVRAPGRTAALLSISGGPALWLSLGEMRDGVTLEDVGATSVTIDTARGERQVALGPADPPPQLAAGAPDALPPGFRQPPEPASAPGADR